MSGGPDGGGCERPRVTFVEPLQRYIMTYTAFSVQVPRIALALSADLFHRQHLDSRPGPYHGVEAGDVDDKNASLFPVAIPNPSGHPELAILHRPPFPGTRPPSRIPRCRSRSGKLLDLVLPEVSKLDSVPQSSQTTESEFFSLRGSLSPSKIAELIGARKLALDLP